MTGLRLALAALLAAHVALALLASTEVPLWEPVEELAAVRQAQALGGAVVSGDLTPQPIASRAVNLLGLRLLGLEDTAFLARKHGQGTAHVPARWLHGPDELPPFIGPARGLHELRWLSALFGALAVLAAHALARRVFPARPGLALLAAALVAFSPPFLAACGAIGPLALQAALLGAALTALASLAGGVAPSTRRALGTGALLGAARLAGAPLLVVLPLAPLALLLAPGGTWRSRVKPLDRLAAGFLVVAGPMLAWDLVHSAATPGVGTPAAGALLSRWLPLLLWGHVARTAPGVAIGPLALLAWSLLAGLAALGLLRALALAGRGTAGFDARVAALLGASLLLAAGDSLTEALGGRAPEGRDLLPVGGAVAALLVAGLVALWPKRWPRTSATLATLLVAALAALAFDHLRNELGPAYRPLNRVEDPHLLCFDPLADVPEPQHLATIQLLAPPGDKPLAAPPVLRWKPVRTPDTRYSVHFGAPGAAWSQRSFEDFGLSYHDSYEVPAALWNALPPDVELELRVVRLPPLKEALAKEPLFVDESRPVRVKRAGP